MEDKEKRALSTYPIPLPFWKMYVDDTLTALLQDKVQHFRQHLNPIETTIQFTIEMEAEGALVFLTHHTDGSLSTTVFRKSIHTDKYLGFQSHHPLAHKVAVARTLFDRAEKICSDFPDSEKEKEHVAKALQNSHPYYHQRCVMEARHIRMEHQTVNRDEGPLPSEYNPLIGQLRPAAV